MEFNNIVDFKNFLVLLQFLSILQIDTKILQMRQKINTVKIKILLVWEVPKKRLVYFRRIGKSNIEDKAHSRSSVNFNWYFQSRNDSNKYSCTFFK